MEHHSEAFVALDTAKLRNAVAIADAGRNGEIRYLGEFDNTEAATRKLDTAVAAIAPAVAPTGYVLPFLNGIAHIDVLNQRFGQHLTFYS